ncbi:TylF/MycF/NovP-related O-methyltransferase [Bradyrhizobium sp. CB82]|uniref:TylF/MycF family methyltransferase n=1 Tax=Bradyrhizobium sp. CB82 TaxID=3039159 RepID=UPI0024B27129|nr:TylF/MycF/NovP-related O-methyltransferase [Bradyrhizobium sp. CB82]WFU37358.1 TylF/MycF/NovP-related O-methyltransferase [Bradyrhizobium sp. CB82]
MIFHRLPPVRRLRSALLDQSVELVATSQALSQLRIEIAQSQTKCSIAATESAQLKDELASVTEKLDAALALASSLEVERDLANGALQTKLSIATAESAHLKADLASVAEKLDAALALASSLEVERDLANGVVQTKLLVAMAESAHLKAGLAGVTEKLDAALALASSREVERDLAKDAFQTKLSGEVSSRFDVVLRSIGEITSEHTDLVLKKVHVAAQTQEQKIELLTANVTAIGSQAEAQMREIRTRLEGDRRSADGNAVGLYLDLLEGSLTGTLRSDVSQAPWAKNVFDPARRAVGRDWPSHAETMIGTARMKNLRALTQRALEEKVPGDLIETGVWRGGACIYMRGILAAAGDTSRRVFVADSFRGLPAPDEAAYPADAGDQHHTFDQLAVSRAEVEANFRRYALLDEQVVFLEGWFKDTLPTAPIEKLAVLRLDGDMYESTMDTLNALYAKVSPGGFVIVDDYILKACAQAVDDFRARYGILAPMHEVDGAAVWWQVPKDSPAGSPANLSGEA